MHGLAWHPGSFRSCLAFTHSMSCSKLSARMAPCLNISNDPTAVQKLLRVQPAPHDAATLLRSLTTIDSTGHDYHLLQLKRWMVRQLELKRQLDYLSCTGCGSQSSHMAGEAAAHAVHPGLHIGPEQA